MGLWPEVVFLTILFVCRLTWLSYVYVDTLRKFVNFLVKSKIVAGV